MSRNIWIFQKKNFIYQCQSRSTFFCDWQFLITSIFETLCFLNDAQFLTARLKVSASQINKNLGLDFSVPSWLLSSKLHHWGHAIEPVTYSYSSIVYYIVDHYISLISFSLFLSPVGHLRFASSSKLELLPSVNEGHFNWVKVFMKLH